MEAVDEGRYHRFRTKHIVVAALVILIIFPLFSYRYYTFAVNRPAQTDKDAKFEIESGDSVSEIGDALYEKGLVNSAFLFKIYLLTKGIHTNVQAGDYVIPAGTSIAELSGIFRHGANDIKITFLEGWRNEEFAREAAKKFGKVDYFEFLKEASQYNGFLFPDTYFFNKNATEKDIVDVLIGNFEAKTRNVFNAGVLHEIGLTQNEVVTFASIVEREVRNEEDRPIVAGILIKRWKSAELIGADATTQYATAHLQICSPYALVICPSEEQAMSLEWWPRVLTKEYLDWNSPYNTRKNVGLPPSPISNPGLASIKAVLNYKDTPNTYYLTDKNGVTHYAKTLEEHNINISKYL